MARANQTHVINFFIRINTENDSQIDSKIQTLDPESFELFANALFASLGKENFRIETTAGDIFMFPKEVIEKSIVQIVKD